MMDIALGHWFPALNHAANPGFSRSSSEQKTAAPAKQQRVILLSQAKLSGGNPTPFSHLVHSLMSRECVACGGSVPCENVQDTWREASLKGKLAHSQSRERRLLCNFDDHSVSCKAGASRVLRGSASPRCATRICLAETLWGKLVYVILLLSSAETL